MPSNASFYPHYAYAGDGSVILLGGEHEKMVIDRIGGPGDRCLYETVWHDLPVREG